MKRLIKKVMEVTPEKEKSMAVSDNTTQAEELGNSSKNLGRISAEAVKKWQLMY